MTDEDVRRLLEAYRVPAVAPDLTDRVLARVHAAPASPHRMRWVAIAAAAGLAVAATTLLVGRRVATTSEGSFAGGDRATLALGTRGVAVAEGGAELRWTVGADGDARVEQRAGGVFYRVEPGGAFRVVTPAGDVTVRGTCFYVEVETMKLSRQHVIAGGVGAAVAAAVLVTVYEGKVGLANDRGSVTLAAGETGRAEGTTGPVAGGSGRATPGRAQLPPIDPAATRETLLAQNALARRELEAANRRIGVLESQVEMARGTREKHVHPTKDQLVAWAERCEVHIDAPDVFAREAKLSPRDVTMWGVSEDEKLAVERALAEIQRRARDEMREIYIAATGNTAGADELEPNAMFHEVLDKAAPGDVLRARTAMAQERAGTKPPPASLAALPPVERAFRLLYRLGNDFETMLGEALSPARAFELRAQYDAWPGIHFADTGCEPHARD